MRWARGSRAHLETRQYAPLAPRIQPIVNGDQVGPQLVAIELPADVTAVLALVKADLRIQREDLRFVTVRGRDRRGHEFHAERLPGGVRDLVDPEGMDIAGQ